MRRVLDFPNLNYQPFLHTQTFVRVSFKPRLSLL